MSRRVATPYSASQVKAAFKAFENGAPPGFIRAADLAKALALYGGGAGTGATTARGALGIAGTNTARGPQAAAPGMGMGGAGSSPLGTATVGGGGGLGPGPLTAERIEELLAQLEPDGLGLINYGAFVDTMMDA